VPTVRELKRRHQPPNLLEKAARSDVKPAPDHLFTDEEVSPALRRLFAIAEAHADLLDNLATESTALNEAVNSAGENALHNARVLTTQIRDEARQGLQQVANEVVTKAPEATATALGTEIYNLRTELSSYDTNIRAKINELDVSSQTSLMALQSLHQDASI